MVTKTARAQREVISNVQTNIVNDWKKNKVGTDDNFNLNYSGK